MFLDRCNQLSQLIRIKKATRLLGRQMNLIKRSRLRRLLNVFSLSGCLPVENCGNITKLRFECSFTRWHYKDSRLWVTAVRTARAGCLGSYSPKGRCCIEASAKATARGMGGKTDATPLNCSVTACKISFPCAVRSCKLGMTPANFRSDATPSCCSSLIVPNSRSRPTKLLYCVCIGIRMWVDATSERMLNTPNVGGQSINTKS